MEMKEATGDLLTKYKLKLECQEDQSSSTMENIEASVTMDLMTILLKYSANRWDSHLLMLTFNIMVQVHPMFSGMIKLPALVQNQTLMSAQINSIMMTALALNT